MFSVAWIQNPPSAAGSVSPIATQWKIIMACAALAGVRWIFDCVGSVGALDGSLIKTGLLWLVNTPDAFVGTLPVVTCCDGFLCFYKVNSDRIQICFVSWIEMYGWLHFCFRYVACFISGIFLCCFRHVCFFTVHYHFVLGAPRYLCVTDMLPVFFQYITSLFPVCSYFRCVTLIVSVMFPVLFQVYYMYVSDVVSVSGMLPFLWGAFRSSKKHHWLSRPQMKFSKRRSKSTTRSSRDISRSWYQLLCLLYQYTNHL